MIDERIGIIGKIQGVKDSNRPKIKKSKIIKNELSLFKTSAILAVLPSSARELILSKTPFSSLFWASFSISLDAAGASLSELLIDAAAPDPLKSKLFFCG